MNRTTRTFLVVMFCCLPQVGASADEPIYWSSDTAPTREAKLWTLDDSDPKMKALLQKIQQRGLCRAIPRVRNSAFSSLNRLEVIETRPLRTRPVDLEGARSQRIQKLETRRGVSKKERQELV